jgi:hypothetical protein
MGDEILREVYPELGYILRQAQNERMILRQAQDDRGKGLRMTGGKGLG